MENFYLPFYIQTDIYREYQMKNHKIDKKEAKKMAADNLELFLSKLEEKGLQIIEKNVRIDMMGGECITQGTFSLIEEIAEEVPVAQTTGDQEE